MAKASDPRLADVAKKRPSSAPKPGELKDIPKIVLEERKEKLPVLPSSMSTSVYPGAFSSLGSSGILQEFDKREVGGKNFTHVIGPHMTSRSSDSCLPASSMPNLAVPLPGEDLGISENYLEVFCSPRTFRRSVDFDINSKDHACGHFEWVGGVDSSAGLKVLNPSSRVGSALSLNSECTARSIGLLSNDSDSDKDLSLTDSEKQSPKPFQLKRFMSYPEEGMPSDNYARSSQSMSDLKTRSSSKGKTESGSVLVRSEVQTTEAASDERNAVSGTNMSRPPCNNTEEVDKSVNIIEPHPQESKHHVNRKELCRDSLRSGTARHSHMLSYKCETHDTARDGRIRQWLQDMDSQ